MNENRAAERIDLNLFRVFDAVWRAGSLTRAAAELHLTQPAISNALARLRTQFGDPLFVRAGRRVVPTPRARAIAGDVGAALQSLRQALAGQSDFDAATSRRRFVIGMRDMLEFALLPTLGAELQQQAPQIQLQSARIERRRLDEELASGALDLSIDVPTAIGADVCHQRLFQEPLCVAMRRGHPLAACLSADAWLAARHVVVSSRRRGPVLEDAGLQALGLQRAVAVRCQHYYAACHLVAASDLLLVLPRYYGQWFLQHLPLVVAPLPVPLPELTVMMYWHRNVNDDPGHRWLRERVMAQVPQGQLSLGVGIATPARAGRRRRTPAVLS